MAYFSLPTQWKVDDGDVAGQDDFDGSAGGELKEEQQEDVPRTVESEEDSQAIERKKKVEEDE